MVAGIAFINHVGETGRQEIENYINSLKENIKLSDEINQTVILKQSIKQNLMFVLMIWFLGCTLLGSFLIYGAVLYKGFSIGYTASAIIATLGTKSRNDFCYVFSVTSKLDFSSYVIDFVR